MLTLLRRIYCYIVKPPIKPMPLPITNFRGEEANNLIREYLLSDKPVMICRFGSGELGFYIDYKNSQKRLSKYIQYIKREINPFWWDAKRYEEGFYIAGLFPLAKKTFNAFVKIMEKDIKEVDILGSWLPLEDIIEDELHQAIKVPLADLEPYYHQNPWSKVLKGKKVLIVHPFEKSIQKQYAKRELLFANKNVLPSFQLITLKAVQSIAENETGFNNWMEALDYMKQQINKIDFEIAIIGCGAYGFHLAAHVKRIGKKAVHLGGATQCLFGIKGKRWETNQVASLMNEYWERPLEEEVVKNHIKVEGGSYW